MSALNSAGCSACALISFGGQLFTGLESYTDSGQDCPAALGNPCGLAAQRFGTLDLGTYCASFGLAASQPCPEQEIATNGDGVTQASYDGGQISFAISTHIDQSVGSSNEVHVGAAYWMVGTKLFTGGTHLLTLTSQGYVAAAHEDLEFPTLVGGTGSNGAPIGDEVVMIGDLTGREYAFQLSSGALLDTLILGSKNAFWASTAISDSLVFNAGTDGNLYAVG